MIFRCRARFTRSGHLPVHLRRGRALLLRVGEDAQPLEALLAHEAEQVLEVLLGLAGQPDDERGAQGDARARGRGASASSARRNFTSRPRFMERSSRSDECCSGMSTYFAILGSRAMTSTSASGKSRG